ncbi:MAG: PD-(D/E)XK nuclease family transposase [Bacteroidales bacterium]|nr:PD-(D/E)XK nuclease family transposase [Bacteroidales bacterium]
MSRALRFAFLEIARFNKTQEECNSFEDKFLYMMKNLPTFVETPELWDDDYFHEMMQEAEYANMTEQERWEYALAMKHKWDYQNTIDFAREEGREEGKIDVAKEMLADKVPVETIIKYTGLTEEQVRAL